MSGDLCRVIKILIYLTLFNSCFHKYRHMCIGYIIVVVESYKFYDLMFFTQMQRFLN